MPKSPAREATNSPEFAAMDFETPPRPTSVGNYFDERALRISNLIDEELKPPLPAGDPYPDASTGKSTLQKQFQLFYASQTLDRERPSWRPVVYFNILKAVRMILDELDYDFSTRSQANDDEAVPSSSKTLLPEEPAAMWWSEIQELRAQLLPLIAMEDSLATDLSGGVSVTGGRTGAYVRAGWQALVTSTFSPAESRITESKHTSEVVTLASRTLAANVEPIKALWEHPAVKRLLDSRKLRLDESAPFFLASINRLAEPDFLPSNDDILNVRLQTLGVMEHTFPVDMGGSTYDWKLYDVGGAYLEEDPKTNRIDDSLQLFNAICSNKLLVKAHLVLLLNKADLLKKKLAAGTKVRKYYGDRPNVYESVSDYFRSHFTQVHRRKDIAKRTLYIHFTSMLDIKATQSIIANVGEVILRQHIKQIGLA
ncbi:hypothetical protein H0H81_001218 [Sphagnurus paluster]|uniref:Uncharacterized protein n=1 Tax=Sphagnurus paluster TaxID=117069 RepID=A0A9P7G0F3_9AGAR|nr:hypothetical protein H0H81_001218 [Sphagnurus paluster]